MVLCFSQYLPSPENEASERYSDSLFYLHTNFLLWYTCESTADDLDRII